MKEVLSLAQRLIRFFVSAATFQRMKEDSMRWVFVCASCQKESSIWEIGGIRYKAFGESRTGIMCPGCRKFAMQKLKYKPDDAAITRS